MDLSALQIRPFIDLVNFNKMNYFNSFVDFVMSLSLWTCPP